MTEQENIRERIRYVHRDLPAAGVAITFANIEDAVHAREFIPPGLPIRSLGLGFVAPTETLQAIAEAGIPVYRFVPPGKPLGEPLDVNSLIERIKQNRRLR